MLPGGTGVWRVCKGLSKHQTSATNAAMHRKSQWLRETDSHVGFYVISPMLPEESMISRPIFAEAPPLAGDANDFSDLSAPKAS